MQLTDKVVIVTGAGGGGAGQAVARRFAREGAAVIVSDIDDAGGRETVRLIEAQGGRAAYRHADVASEAEVRDLFAFADQTYGGVDVLVNDASTPYRPEEPLEHWLQTVAVDLLGPMFATRFAVDAVQRRGGGAVVNIGSVSALGHGRLHSGSPAYDVAKAGVIRLTTTLGWLRERYGVRVNCLVPGWIESPEVKAYVDSLTPQERRQRDVPATILTLDQVADVVVRLATDESLAGRVMVWWNDQPPRFIPAGDPGYASLE
jgi:NAD(P)-dependent dehydrogenase (short-subunit alcohol dehydrogenase family)